MRWVVDAQGVGLLRESASDQHPPALRHPRRSVFNAAERAQPGIFSQLIVGPLFHEHRILCQVAGHRMNVVKALPALVVEESEIRRFAAALDDVIIARAFACFGVGMAGRALTRHC